MSGIDRNIVLLFTTRTLRLLGYPDERSAAAGITGIARSIGASLSPVVAGALFTLFLSGPFIVAGGLKIIYDLILFRSFKAANVADEV